MALAPATLRAHVEAAMLLVLGAQSPAWQVSRLAYPMFPGSDPANVEALAFAVGLGPSTPLRDRQSRETGFIVMRTELIVRFTSLLRGDAHVADYDRALTREQLVVETLRAIHGGGVYQGPALRVENIDREVRGDGTIYVGTVTCTTVHGYPINSGGP